MQVILVIVPRGKAGLGTTFNVASSTVIVFRELYGTKSFPDVISVGLFFINGLPQGYPCRALYSISHWK